jgi:class 3 adenylate cyclase
MAGLLAHHDRVVRDAVVRSGGRVFSTGGDGFGVVFADVTGAIGCALGVQDALTPISVLRRRGHDLFLDPTREIVPRVIAHLQGNDEKT